MAPNKSIKDFFKPAVPSSRPARDPKPTEQADQSTPRIWPTPRTRSRHDDASTRRATASPTPTQVPTKRSAIDSEQTPQANAMARPPSTSQSSTSSSASQRIVINGEQVVTNSDSDTDSEEMPDLDWDFRKSPPRENISNDSSAYMTSREDRATRSGACIPWGQRNGLRKPADKRFKPSKRSLNHLVEAAQKNAETEKKIAEAKANLEKPTEHTPAQELVIDEKLLATVVDDDEDGEKARRLLLAMQRTNTLHLNCVFHFFEEDAHHHSIPRPSFPSQSLPKHVWAANFEDSRNTGQAFLTGHAQHIFQYQDLPEELASWMIDELPRELADILNVRYLQLLNSHPQHLHTILTRTKLNDIFRCLGAKVEDISASQSVGSSQEPPNTPKRPLPRSLKWVILLLQQSAPKISPESRAHALNILFHLSIDDSILADAAFVHAIQDAIETILCCVRDTELSSILNELIPILLTRIDHPVLQNNLVLSLPTNTPLTAYFQRHMALSCLFYPTQFVPPLSSPALPSLIYTYLQASPDFTITRETDYTALAARLSLLDIGIGPGLTKVPFFPSPNPTSIPGGSTIASTSTSIPAPFPPVSAEEIAFNKQVDALAQQVKLLSNNIIEAGAMSDLTRLDAKDSSERLYYRLESAVRTRGRKKRHAFGGPEDEEEVGGRKKVWGKWFKGRNIKTESASIEEEEVNGVKRGGVSEEVDGVKEEDMCDLNGL